MNAHAKRLPAVVGDPSPDQVDHHRTKADRQSSGLKQFAAVRKTTGLPAALDAAARSVAMTAATDSARPTAVKVRRQRRPKYPKTNKMMTTAPTSQMILFMIRFLCACRQAKNGFRYFTVSEQQPPLQTSSAYPQVRRHKVSVSDIIGTDQIPARNDSVIIEIYCCHCWAAQPPPVFDCLPAVSQHNMAHS